MENANLQQEIIKSLSDYYKINNYEEHVRKEAELKILEKLKTELLMII